MTEAIRRLADGVYAVMRGDDKNRHTIAGNMLIEARKLKPDDVPWCTFLRRNFKLEPPRAYLLMNIAKGRIDAQEHLKHKREKMQEARKNPSAKKTESVQSNSSIDDDSEQVVWHRGLIFRAQEAIVGAEFEDWSEFKVDRQLVKVAKQAAEAWKKLATYLEGRCT
jgi:hypothetical protein